MPLPRVPALTPSMPGLLLSLLMAAGSPTAGATKPAAPAPLQGAVTQVIDGDTLRFSVPGQAAIEVRLASIDAPELCQPWGPEARKALIELALNKPATLRTTGRDGARTVGVLTVEGLNISQRLVEEGHAWSVRGRNGRGPFVKQERMAQSLTRGLHAGGGAVYPTDFTRDRGPCR